MNIVGAKILSNDDSGKEILEDSTNVQVQGDQTSEIFVGVKLVAAPTSPSCTTTAAPSTSPSGSPSLPVTGDRTMLIGGIGALIVTVGAVAFVVGRKRRNRFVA